MLASEVSESLQLTLHTTLYLVALGGASPKPMINVLRIYLFFNTDASTCESHASLKVLHAKTDIFTVAHLLGAERSWQCSCTFPKCVNKVILCPTMVHVSQYNMFSALFELVFRATNAILFLMT